MSMVTTGRPQSAISRQFLDAMYRRLFDAQRGMHEATNKESREGWDSIRCCVTCSIDDYLAAHAPAPKEAP